RFRTLNPSYGGRAQVDRPIAAFLRSYQLSGGYTPGPLLALACLLFTSTAVVVLFAPDVYEFSWRYQLPAVITLVPAGVLGISALLSLGHPQAGARKHLFGRPRARPHPGGDTADE